MGFFIGDPFYVHVTASVLTLTYKPGSIAQSVGHLTRKSVILGSISDLATFVSPSSDSRAAVVSSWRKYVHEVLVNRSGGLSLPRKSVVRLTDCPGMTLDVYRGCKPTTQQHSLIKSQMFTSLAVSVTVNKHLHLHLPIKCMSKIGIVAL